MNCHYSICKWLQSEQQIETVNKKKNLREKAVEAVRSYFATQNLFPIELLSIANNLACK